MAHAASSLHFSPRARLKDWKSHINKSGNIGDVVGEDDLVKRFGLSTGVVILTLAIDDGLPDLENQRARLGDKLVTGKM